MTHDTTPPTLEMARPLNSADPRLLVHFSGNTYPDRTLWQDHVLPPSFHNHLEIKASHQTSHKEITSSMIKIDLARNFSIDQTRRVAGRPQFFAIVPHECG